MSYFLNIDKYSNSVAVTESSGKQVSYSELISISEELADKLGRRRCLVIIMCSNTLASLSAYIGCLRNNIVPLLINNSIDQTLLEDLLNSYRPAFLFIPFSKVPFAMQSNIVFHLFEYCLVKTNYNEDYTINDELGILLTTSGSTGSAKFVRQSYKNISSNTRSIIEYLQINAEDKAITTLPMSYTYGLSIINTHLACGASLVLTEHTLVDKKFWELFKAEKVTTFGGVPFTFEMLKRLRFERMELPDLRYITQAGGRLQPELVKYFADICRKKNIKFIVMYGQTEATARISWLPWEFIDKKPASIGLAIPEGTLFLIDSDGNIISEAEKSGELVYDGPNVTLGYSENSYDLAKGDERNGRLFTGDLATMDNEGFFYITGRVKRFLKVFGHRINLDELEELIKKEGYECICAGSDENLKVYLLNNENVNLVEKYLVEKLIINKAGFKIFVIDQIPRNDSGKILYSSLP